MTTRPPNSLLAVILLLLCGAPAPMHGQEIPSPASHFGFEPGADRKLAEWTQLVAYYDALAEVSPRVTIDTLGFAVRGQPFVMLTITSEENHARLEALHEIQMRLADPRRVSGEEELERLVRDGKTVVLLTHNIHAPEVGTAQVAPVIAHRLATSTDERVREILDNVILLQIPSLNPDGTQWITEWYNRWVGTQYEAAPLPWLYHFYTGHDNNRDWYSFTQPETRLTVTGAHNAWHPQIVHDVHQMGNGGARIFFPPFIDPWEPNVDPALIGGVNQLGSYMAAELMAQGKKGVVTGAIYDGFSPARAYMHYHGGARVLSETASARLATPIDQSPDDIGGGRGYDATQATYNYPEPWRGGPWGLPQIVEYQDAGVMAVLTNAAKNREYWLRNFYGVNLRAVEKWDRWPDAWVIPSGQDNDLGVSTVLDILTTGDVEVHRAQTAFRAGGRDFPAGSWVVPMRQPYASFAQTLLEVQEYPDLRLYPGGPPRPPYDVTAHTLPLLMNVEAVPVDSPVEDVPLSAPIDSPEVEHSLPAGLSGAGAPRIALYKSWQEPMPEGWTRWVLDQHELAYDTIHDADVRSGGLDRYDVLLLESQAASSILEGFPAGVLPPEYTGGIGEEGARALESFVREGGRLVAIENATELAIDLFDLGVSDATGDLPSQEFYIPGSILRLTLDEDHPVAQGLASEGVAWFRNSRAFDVSDPALRVVGRYGTGDPLLSGWALGAGHVAGRAAIVEAQVGRGSVVLFGFPPNYRAQSIATWPLLLNALMVRPAPQTQGGFEEQGGGLQQEAGTGRR